MPESPLAAQGTAAPPEAPVESISQIPDELLRNPVTLSLLIGKPVAAVSAKKLGESNEIKQLFNNMESLLPSGISFYRSIKGSPYVVFNALHVHPHTIIEADEQNKLHLIAPPWETVENLVRRAFGELSPQAQPQAAGPESPTAPPENNEKPAEALPEKAEPASLPPPPVKPSVTVRRQVMARRLAALPTSGPASGPAPGGGRLLNLIKSFPV